MIAVVNYGLGNLHSVRKAVEFVGGKPVVTDEPDVIRKAQKVILPGVGAFKDGMKGLETKGLILPLVEAAQKGTLLLGICLGMQLFFTESQEQGHHKGLGFIQGKVVLFVQPGIKVPQIGWNQIQVKKDAALFSEIQNGDYFYFNHSYYCVPYNQETVAAYTEYGLPFVSAVESGNLFGVQFHPEKSQKLGLKVLKNFVEL